MYTIESLHHSLNFDVLGFTSIYTTFGGFPIVYCVVQTAVRGAFRTPCPTRGLPLYISRPFGQTLGPFTCCKPRALPIDTVASGPTPGSAFATGYRSPTIEPPSSFPGRPPPQNAHCCSRIVDRRIPPFLVQTLDQYCLHISRPHQFNGISQDRRRSQEPCDHLYDQGLIPDDISKPLVDGTVQIADLYNTCTIVTAEKAW